MERMDLNNPTHFELSNIEYPKEVMVHSPRLVYQGGHVLIINHYLRNDVWKFDLKTEKFSVTDYHIEEADEYFDQCEPVVLGKDIYIIGSSHINKINLKTKKTKAWPNKGIMHISEDREVSIEQEFEEHNERTNELLKEKLQTDEEFSEEFKRRSMTEGNGLKLALHRKPGCDDFTYSFV